MNKICNVPDFRCNPESDRELKDKIIGNSCFVISIKFKEGCTQSEVISFANLDGLDKRKASSVFAIIDRS
ncbi:MAG: hypothetical protein L6N94_05475 [Candidatus Methylarchaceae archaeon HK01M]|nr:hypothetical protein [Candidatus Methylarchaceae archaeon HK01M]